MSYLHIENLYRPRAQRILLFKECYALEKIHGTSARLNWQAGTLTFSSGGASHVAFKAFFEEDKLRDRFEELGHEIVTVYGEAYGGKVQKMSATYGPQLRFVVFDIQVHETWLNVENAADVARKLGLEFVPYERISTDLAEIDRQRDLPSVQATRNGITGDKVREGIVLRPLEEFVDSAGDRVIAKHKRPEFSERVTLPEVDAEQLELLREAEAIALEWVTEMRLDHVLDKLGNPSDMTSTKIVIQAMLEDVYREASGEIEESVMAQKAISKATAMLFKNRLMATLHQHAE